MGAQACSKQQINGAAYSSLDRPLTSNMGCTGSKKAAALEAAAPEASKDQPAFDKTLVQEGDTKTETADVAATAPGEATTEASTTAAGEPEKKPEGADVAAAAPAAVPADAPAAADEPVSVVTAEAPAAADEPVKEAEK